MKTSPSMFSKSSIKAKTISLPKVPLGSMGASGKAFEKSLNRFARDTVTSSGNMQRARGNYSKNAPPNIGLNGFPSLVQMGKR